MVDTAAPALLSSTPRDGGTISATATSMTLTFGEAVQRGTGNLVVYDTANNTPVKSYAIATSTDIGFSANNTVLTLSGLSLTAATNYHIKVDSGAITDLATNSYAGFNDTTTLNFATPGVPVIDLGGDFGKLIAPVQVEDKWYYYWDLSGDGTNGGIDAQTMDWLERTFYNGVSTGAVITENNRTFSINGVNVKLPTYGGATNNGFATPTDGINAFQKGTAVANTSTINTTYDDLLAIWDALNGNLTTTNLPATLPTHWKSGRYWSATQTANNPHAIVNLASGFVNNQLPDGSADTYFALQVL
jgi:hypothetical protein